jgi:hypothetical protein
MPGQARNYTGNLLINDFDINTSPEILALADNNASMFFAKKAPEDFLDVLEHIKYWYGIDGI